jgi:hypothetical protein
VEAAIRKSPVSDFVVFRQMQSDFWSSLFGEEPKDFQVKQNAAYRWCLKKNESEWLFLCDADEFIICRGDIREVLSSISPDIHSAALPTAEAVWLESKNEDFDIEFSCTHFRRPIGRLWGANKRLLYGKYAKYYQHNLLGHRIGKQFLRKNADFDRLTSHVALKDGKSLTRPISQVAAVRKDTELAHFDAISFPRWLRKMRRRIDGEIIQGRTKERKGQQKLLQEIFEQEGEEFESDAAELFRNLYCLSRRSYHILRAQGKAFEYKIP